MSLASMSWETAQVRVTRTFLEVVEMCAAPQARSRTMPALPSLGFDLEGEPAPGLAVLAEPSFEGKHHESEESFGASASQRESDPMLPGTPILPDMEEELESEMTPLPDWLVNGFVRVEKENSAPGDAVLAEPSFEGKHHESDQDQKFVFRVARTFLEVIPAESASPQLRSSSMPVLPSCGLDFQKEGEEEESFGASASQRESDPMLPGTPILSDTEEELESEMTPPPHCLVKGFVRVEKENSAPGDAVLAEPSFKEKHHESDQDQKFVVRVARTFLEVIPAESASLQLRSSSMPVLPSCGFDFEKEGQDEESFGASEGQEAPEPILRGTPIFHLNLAEPVVGITMPQAVEEMEGQAMEPTPHWAEPLLPGLVVHPVHTDPNVQTQEEIDVERITGEEKAVGNEDEREELKLVLQHADSHSGPFPLRMIEQHNNGQCFPCLFFSGRGDGCRKGDDCTHCHVCLPHEIRRRRNRISAELKRARKASARHQHHGGGLKEPEAPRQSGSSS